MPTNETSPLGSECNAELGGDTPMQRRQAARPVMTVEELQAMDKESMVRGYIDGLDAQADWAQRDRGYWHGYLNGLVDGGHTAPSPEQHALAREYVNSGALRADVQRWAQLAIYTIAA